MTLTDWVAIAAFLLAAYALYRADLKRADITMSLMPKNPPGLGPVAENEASAVPIEIPLYVYNDGARGGALTAIEIVEWDDGAAGDLLSWDEVSVRPQLPVAYDGGEVSVVMLAVLARLAPAASRQKLPKHEELRILIQYTGLRGRTLVASLVAFLIRRPGLRPVTRTLEARVPLAMLHDWINQRSWQF